MPDDRLGGARQRHPSPRWRWPALAGLALVLGGLPAAPPPPAGAGPPAADATTEAGHPAAHRAVPSTTTSAAGSTSPRQAPVPSAVPAGGAAALPSGAPTSISIPAVGVDAPVVTLGLDADGTLEVPAGTGDTGWYRHGPRPGEQGPAVVAGHVDSRSGPAVFYRLRDVRPGDEIVVGYRGGHRVTFRVTGVERHAKDDFPTTRVYGRTAGAELRLITCGGDFDRTSRHYRDNVIVFAELARPADVRAAEPG